MHLYRCSNSRYVDYICTCILWYRYISFSCSTIAVISDVSGGLGNPSSDVLILV